MEQIFVPMVRQINAENSFIESDWCICTWKCGYAHFWELQLKGDGRDKAGVQVDGAGAGSEVRLNPYKYCVLT